MALLQLQQIAGMNTHYYYFPVNTFLEAQAKAGVTSIAFHAKAPHFWMDHTTCQDTAGLRKQAEALGLSFVAFCPESPTYPYQVCAAEEGFAARSLAYLKKGLLAAKALGASYYLLSASGGCFDEPPKKTYRRAVEVLSALAPLAEEAGLTIAVKTTTPAQAHLVNTLPELQRLLADVDHPAVKGSLDLVSMGVAGESPEAWFETLGEDLVYSVFTDGRPEGHLIWGDGLFPLKKYLRVFHDYGYSGYLAQEITDYRYFKEPETYDRINIGALKRGAGL